MTERILHLFRIQKFTEGFVNFINKNFGYENHFFLVWGDKFGNDRYEYLKNVNVKYVPHLKIELHKDYIDKYMNEFNKIIYHGVFEDYVLLFFYQHKYLLKKLYLYFWGGDKVLVGNFMQKKIKRYVVKYAAAIITIISGDYRSINKTYRPKGKWFCAIYYEGRMERAWKHPKDTGITFNKECIKIVIGNSATQTNQHMKILEQLSKYKDENIEIYMPLSYGDMEYAKEVISFGEKIYGSKLVPLQDFMPVEQYCDFMRDMNIAIFAMKRQQALGNIYLLLMSGCKLYLQRDGLLSEFFEEEVKCKLAHIEDINDMDFGEFISYSNEQRKYNIESVGKTWNESYAVDAWRTVFTY